MKVGWMWFDDDPERSIEEKVAQAIVAYVKKFGRAPTQCYINQCHISGSDGFTVGKIKVIAVPNILPHHFWLGVDKEAIKA